MAPTPIIAGAKKAAVRLMLMAASKKTRNTEIEKHGNQVELKTALLTYAEPERQSREDPSKAALSCQARA